MERGGAVASEARVVNVGQGVFALRYVGSAARPRAPRIAVDPGAGSGVSLIAAPGRAERELQAPGDCLLIRAERPARVTLIASGWGAGGSLDADVTLEPLIGPGPAAMQEAAPALSVVAHLAGRGDVRFEAGSWIGGPSGPTRIEGLALHWSNRPDDVELLLTVVSEGARGRRRFPARPTGAFAGTRGEAAPVVAMEIALSGAGADRYRLAGEAQFLGGPVQVRDGARLRFASSLPGGGLIGLKLELALQPERRRAVAPEAVEVPRPGSSTSSRPAPTPAATRVTPGRVRHFRPPAPSGDVPPSPAAA